MKHFVYFFNGFGIEWYIYVSFSAVYVTYIESYIPTNY